MMLVAGAAISQYHDTSSSPLLSLIRKNYNPQTPLSTKFTLTLYWSVREKEEKKQGSILLAPGDRFKVKAGEETFVSNGTAFWQYNDKANQVVVKPLAEVDRSTLPSQLFAGYIGACSFREVERKGGTALLSWKDDSAHSAYYTAIKVWVSIKNGCITKCALTDRNGNVFTYTFAATTFGKKFKNEEFEFAIPKNARIIDMRK